MRVRLKAIATDLEKPDEDLVLLALSTLKRGELATQRYDFDELCRTREILGNLARAQNPDIVLHARNLLAELDQNPVIVEAGGPKASSPPGPGSPSPPAQAAGGNGARVPQAVPAAAPPGPGTGLLDKEQLLALPPEEQLRWLVARRETAGPELRPLVVATLEAPQLAPPVLATLVSLLARIGTRDELPLLRKLQTWADGRVRANVIEAIEAIGSPPEVFAMLVGHLKDPDARACANAVAALGRLDPKMVSGALAAMARSGSIAAKASALYVLGTQDAAHAIDLLEELAGDESEEVRRRVAEALDGKVGDRVEALLVRLVNDIDVDVAERALELYEILEARRLLGGGAGEATVPGIPASQLGSGAPRPSPGPAAATPAPAPEFEDPSQGIDASWNPPGGFDGGWSPPGGADGGWSPPGGAAGGWSSAPSSSPPRSPAPPPAPPPPPPEPEPDPQVSEPGLGMSVLDLEDGPPAPGFGAAPEAAVGEDFGFDPGSETGPEPAPSPDTGEADGPGLDGLPPDLLLLIDEVHEEIDGELTTMGQKGYQLAETGRIQHDAVRQACYRVKRFVDLLEKRKQAELEKSGLFTRLTGVSVGKVDPARERLERSVTEEYRKTGEVLIDILHKEDLRFPELDAHYRKVESLLEKVHTLRSSSG